MSERKIVWWKVIVGVVLVYAAVKALLFPGYIPPALRYSNPDQEAGGKFAQFLVGGLGALLLFSGLIKGKRTNQQPNSGKTGSEGEDSSKSSD
jgi:hypothetical protein